MKIYTCNCFDGHWPVGASAVVIAENIEQATDLLSKKLFSIGLPQPIESGMLKEVDTSRPHVVVLNDGEY